MATQADGAIALRSLLQDRSRWPQRPVAQPDPSHDDGRLRQLLQDLRISGLQPDLFTERMDRVVRAEAAQRGVTPEQVRAEYTQGQSIRRFVDPQEIADMCLFLASPAAKMVSGQAIAVDGHTETFHMGN